MPNLRIKLGDPKDPDNLKVIEWGDDLVTLAEAEKIERIWGGNWPQFIEAVWSDNARALRTLVWSLMARDDSGLRYEQVDIPRGHFQAQPICVVCGSDVNLVMIDAKRKLATDSTPEKEQRPGWVHEHGHVACEAPKEQVTGGPRPVPKGQRPTRTAGRSAPAASNTSPPSPTSSASDPGSGDN